MLLSPQQVVREIPGSTRRLQIPPLRFAPVGMTRGEGWLRLEL